MKEVALPVRTAYLLAMRGNIMLNGSPVAVYGKILPPDVPYPYVYIPSQRSNNDYSKDSISIEHMVNVEAAVKSMNGSNQNELDIITSQVKEILAVIDHIDMVKFGVDFWSVDVELEDDQDLEDYMDDGIVLRRVMTFKNTIEAQ